MWIKFFYGGMMKPIITVTDRAWEQVIKNLEKEKATTVVVGVNQRGCNGYSYTFDIQKSVPEIHNAIQKDGYFITVDPLAEMFLIGTEMDFTGDDLFNRHFVFHNPNATGECGCGESVSF